jgi:omega-6 fatty acid desaturase (delta-12 desaturase)
MAGWIVRLFIIQHDCGHRSLFASRWTNDWIGRAISLITLTPYTYWRLQHARHHAASGNLDRRGVGDIPMLTMSEYSARTAAWRRWYRFCRHPIVLFGIGPTVQFWLLYRVPLLGPCRHRGDRMSILGTDAALALLYFIIAESIGLIDFLLAFLPAAVLAASGGVWLFYIQHHFPGTYWCAPTAGSSLMRRLSAVHSTIFRARCIG